MNPVIQVTIAFSFVQVVGALTGWYLRGRCEEWLRDRRPPTAGGGA
jgi:hypothetical protein